MDRPRAIHRAMPGAARPLSRRTALAVGGFGLVAALAPAPARSRSAPAAATPPAGIRVVDLGTLGGRYGVPQAINDAGQVVGQPEAGIGRLRAFLWEAGRMTDLGALGGDGRLATALNRAGEVVGWAEDADGHERPVRWSIAPPA